MSVGSYEKFRYASDKRIGADWDALAARLGTPTWPKAAVPGPLYLRNMGEPWGDEVWLAIDQPATRQALVESVSVGGRTAWVGRGREV